MRLAGGEGDEMKERDVRMKRGGERERASENPLNAPLVKGLLAHDVAQELVFE